MKLLELLLWIEVFTFNVTSARYRVLLYDHLVFVLLFCTIVIMIVLSLQDCGLVLSTEAEGRGCYPLDDHVLCKSCNAKRVQALTSHMTTEL